MGKINRGKDFEKQIRTAFERIPNTSVTRLLDPQSGYAGVRNICDFIVYNYPHQYFIECKSCYGNTLPFSNITDTQWRGLAEVSKIKGVVAGYIIWFIDHDKTIFVPAQNMIVHKEAGSKSWNIIKDLDSVELNGKKKKILFEYDLNSLFKRYNSDKDSAV